MEFIFNWGIKIEIIAVIYNCDSLPSVNYDDIDLSSVKCLVRSSNI